MKIVKASISLLLLLIQSLANAALPTGAMPFDVNLPLFKGGISLGLTAIHWEPSSERYDYALTYPLNTINLPDYSNGLYHSLNPDSRWVFQFDLGYTLPCQPNQVVLSVLNYHQSSSDYIEIDTAGSILPSLSSSWPVSSSVLINQPLLGEAQQLTLVTAANFVSAKTTVNHNRVDLIFNTAINLGSQTRANYYAGVRYSNLRNDIGILYGGNSSDLTGNQLINPATDSSITLILASNDVQQINQKSRFSGAGPRLGLNMEYALCWGFGLVGDISTSVLLGDTNTSFHSSLYQSTVATIVDSNLGVLPIGTIFTNLLNDETAYKYKQNKQVIPNIDGKLGLNYTYIYCLQDKKRVNVELGYRVSYYYNSIQRLNPIDDRQFALRVVDMAFEGFYFSIALNL